MTTETGVQFTGLLKPMMAGAMAGTTVDLFFYPIDTLKTRLQSRQGFIASGGFKGVYKGLGSVAVGSAPGAALFFTTYEYCKRSIIPSLLPSLSSPVVHMIAASLGEVAACLVRVPTEVVKQRQQTAAYGSSTSSARALQLVIQQGGFKSLYQGFGITISREVPFSLLQFPLYERLKSQAAERRSLPSSDQLPAHVSAICGSIAGATAAALTTPLDVIKTRIMLTKQRDGARIGIPESFARVYREEGLSAFWKGVVPRTIWIGLGGAVFLGVYELSIQQLGTII
ncbi:S-adenosylmethionine transporter [Puccinia graminis f. sp. tritici]|uniref:S-adenosylmethionine transporter n=1 Tax=Puccinia graminis f. sp. tritici TaxID=56615 RepID=A0A5B0NBX8_PUCGR|nr:S-adenosylmethionine transporter [Puccinia graminis f. sp. tritici]KAA1128009.1 S-adenosylmethionine transporter [Puccinia graminis f. sp. tritici]